MLGRHLNGIIIFFFNLAEVPRELLSPRCDAV